MPASRSALALLVTTLVLAATGCASGDASTNDAAGSNGDSTLAESDIATVLDAKRRIDAACGSDGSGSPDRSSQELAGAVAEIASVTEQYPDRVYETGNDDRALEMRRIAEQTSEQLRRCGIPGEADRLAQVTDAAG